MGVSEQGSGLGEIDHIVVLMLENRRVEHATATHVPDPHWDPDHSAGIRAQAGLPLEQP